MTMYEQMFWDEYYILLDEFEFQEDGGTPDKRWLAFSYKDKVKLKIFFTTEGAVHHWELITQDAVKCDIFTLIYIVEKLNSILKET